MFCPKCSQQQNSGDARFCSRCGFPLEGVAQLLATGGQLSAPRMIEGVKAPASPRLKGVKQGGKIILSGLLIVPLLALMQEEMMIISEGAVEIGALICFMGGFVRILYALLFQDGPLRRKPQQFVAAPLFAPATPPIGAWAQQTNAALPQAEVTSLHDYAAQRVNTSEIHQPASVVDHTTRLLAKDLKTWPERQT